MSFEFFTGVDGQRQHILLWWQRAGGVIGERTWRAVGLVEIDYQVVIAVGWIDVKIAARAVSVFAASIVSENHEEPWLILFRHRVQPVGLAIHFKHDRAG